MQPARIALVLACAVLSGACFQFSTVLTVRRDGSGTIAQRFLLTPAAAAQLRQFATLGGGGSDFDPVSEQQARDAAGTMGAGVTYVSSTPIDTAEGVGRDVMYAFTDINTLRLDQAPPMPGGMPTPAAGPDEGVSFTLTRTPGGNALLTIVTPQLPSLTGDAPGSPGDAPSAEQLAVLRPMLAGARVAIAVEPAGVLVRTSTPHVAGQRVTLVEVDLDELFRDEKLLQRLHAARTPDEIRAIVADVPGLKLNLDPEITIEFR